MEEDPSYEGIHFPAGQQCHSQSVNNVIADRSTMSSPIDQHCHSQSINYVIPVPARVGINCGGNPVLNSMQYCVYILASREKGIIIYTVITGNLVKRVYENKEGQLEGSTKKVEPSVEN